MLAAFKTSLKQFPSPSTFKPLRDIPDLTGKLRLLFFHGFQIHHVFGSDRNSHQRSCRFRLPDRIAIVTQNATVYIATRSETKAIEAIQKLKAETGKEAAFISLDLVGLLSVKRAAQEFLQKEEKLDILRMFAWRFWTETLFTFSYSVVSCLYRRILTVQGHDLRQLYSYFSP